MRPRPAVATTLLAALALLAGQACEGVDPRPGFRVHTMGATGPMAGLPDGVDRLVVRILDPSVEDAPREVVLDRADLGDETAQGVVTELPTGRPIELRVEAMTAEEVSYTGVVGPFTLGSGERRYVDLLLVPTGTVSPIGQLPLPRALHTATTLADGRILVAGGVEVVTPKACDADAPVGSACYELLASRRAWLYDPATGVLSATRSTMVVARAGHTATLLPDGRALLAGGFAVGELVLVSLGEGDRIPRLGAVDEETLASVELFDPTLNAEEDDVEADGDPERGGFVAGPEDMAQARFQHTATLIPTTSGVLLTGGRGPGASDTVEVWSEGSIASVQPLSISRIAHVAVPVTDAVWIVAGAIGAVRNSQLAEVFTASAGEELGSMGPVLAPQFPGDAAAPAANAGLNLVGAAAAPMGGGRYALVAGWLGPLCEEGVAGWTGDVCGPADRSFLVDTETGQVRQPVGKAGEHHSYGAAVATPAGDVFLLGGFTDLALSTTSRVQHLTGVVDEETVTPEIDEAFTLDLAAGRAMLAAAAQTDGAVVVTGGLSIQDDTVSLSDRIEIVNPARTRTVP